MQSSSPAGYLHRARTALQKYSSRALGPSFDSAEIAHYLLAVFVGLLSGAAAIVFRELISAFDVVFYDWGTGAIGEVGSVPAIIIPAIGGLIVGPVIFFLAREAKGHGVPEVMLAIETRGGRIRPRVSAVVAFASAVTISTGGSVGREGPIVQVASALASTVGQVFKLSDENVRVLVAAGAAGGISATFNAPIAGVFFALEVILRHFNVRNFALVVLSSVVAAAVGHAYFGNDPAFLVPAYEVESVGEYPLYLLLGVLAAFASVAFVRTLYWTEDRFDAFGGIPEWTKPAVGGLCVGVMGLWYIELLGTGYGTGPGQFAVPSALIGELALGSLAVLAVLKIVATSLTVGSGGSGGVFAPALFIGAMLGGAFGEVANSVFPGIAPSGAYATVGMAAVFSGGARAPMTAILILFELTRDYSIILPLMVAVVTATALSRAMMKDSIYSLKLRRRGIFLSESRQSPVLAAVPVGTAMRVGTPTLPATAPAQALMEAFGTNGSRQTAVILLDESGHIKAIATATDFTHALENNIDLDAISALDIATQNPVIAYPDESLDEAVRRMSLNSLRQLPVVSRADSGQLLGMLDRSNVFAAYAQQAYSAADNQRLSNLSGIEAYGQRVLGLTVEPGSTLAGKALSQLDLPDDCLVASVIRRGEAIIPRGPTKLQANDWVLIIAAPERHEDIRTALRVTEVSTASISLSPGG